MTLTTATSFSRQFEEAARVEADHLTVEAQRLREEAARHLKIADELAACALDFEGRARDINEMLGRSAQLALCGAPDMLGGEQLRLKAVEVLVEQRGPGFPIHYREWFELVVKGGHHVHGQDPLATFLAQVTRSPVVVSSSSSRGVYALDVEGAAERAASRLRAAELLLVRAQAAVNAAGSNGEDKDGPAHNRRGLEEELALAHRGHRAAKREAAEVARAQAFVTRMMGESEVA